MRGLRARFQGASVRPFVVAAALGLWALGAGAPAPGHAQELVSAGDLMGLPMPAPELVIPYGPDPLQFGHLRLPEGPGPHPVVLFIHGGCWLSAFNIDHAGGVEQGFADEGYAVWSLEYRKVGDPGGEWPAAFADIAAGTDHLRALSRQYPLDLDRVVASGHSAGGQFALWVAARPRIPEASELWSANPLPVDGVFALAPAPDLEALHESGVCGNVIDGLMGGSPAQVPERYAAGSPMDLAPIGVPQTLFVGAHDRSWAPVGRAYLEHARAAGDESIVLVEAPESGHFEMILPDRSTWPLVVEALAALFERTAEHH